MACSRSNGNRQSSGIKVNAPLRQESSLIVQVQKPNVPQIDFEKKQHAQVNFYVGDVRSCSDSNSMVDYIIRWLIEDSIRYSKASVEMLKNHVKSPHIVLIIDRKEAVIPWQGIVLTYRAIMSKISTS